MVSLCIEIRVWDFLSLKFIIENEFMGSVNLGLI